MKTVVKYVDEKLGETSIPNVQNIGFTDAGAIVLTDSEKQVVGVFMPHAIAGIFHPDGRDLVKGVAGTLIQG